jgi:hypothetical protein
MMDNERRADLGREAVAAAATQTNAIAAEPALTAITDVLAYLAHFCDRCRLNPYAVFDAGLRSYEGDFEDGPRAAGTIDPTVPLAGDDDPDGVLGHDVGQIDRQRSRGKEGTWNGPR